MNRYDSEPLESTIMSMLAAVDAKSIVAADVARSTVVASLHGVDTHGISMVPKILNRVNEGRSQLSSVAEPQIADDAIAVEVLDGHLGPGQHTAMAAARIAVHKAGTFGIGHVSVRNSTHFGCCTPFLKHVIDKGMVGFVGSNSLRSMAAFGLRRANLGNNPFGFGVPREDGHHFMFDFSAAVMSFGRREQYLAAGKPLPEGAFVVPESGPDDSGGVCEIADSLLQLALPFGDFKGASVAMIVEFFSALLAQGSYGAETEAFDQNGEFLGASHFVLALNPTLFQTVDFTERAKNYVESMRRGNASVRIPGDRAAQVFAQRTTSGIPIDGKLETQFETLCRNLGVTWPNHR